MIILAEIAPLQAQISLIDDQGRIVVSSDRELHGRSLAASQLVTDFLRTNTIARPHDG